MKYKGIPERWAIIGVAILMVLALGLQARWLSRNTERAAQLNSLELKRSMDSQRWRLDLMMKTFTWDLNREVEYVVLNDSSTDRELIERWLPVLESRFAVNAIGVATDRGDEKSLRQNDSIWRFTSTTRNPLATTLVREWPIRRAAIPNAVAGPPAADPRESYWFSQALENRRDAPVWSEYDDSAMTGELHLSLMVRGNSDSVAYRVIHLDIAAQVMFASLIEWTKEYSTIVLTSKGHSLVPLDTSAVGKAWMRAISDWQNEHPTSEFKVSIGEEKWVGRIVPLDLNGTSIYMGVMLEASSNFQGNDQGRFALWSVFGLLLLLGILLLMVFLQSRGAERQALRQKRRTNLQAQHLAQAIGEREVLDREVHHRVKNNLQVVSSLLNLQAQRVADSAARTEFMRGKRRIDSMALVHHKLYRQQDLSAVDLGVFLEDLAKAVAAMFDPDSRSVSHTVESNDIHCDADTSIQLGMILCELLANCHQHAFPYATGGHIDITVSDPGDGSYILAVKDNGKGFDPSAVPPTHLGLEVVSALAEQLDGSMRVEVAEGTLVEVVFRPNRQA